MIGFDVAVLDSKFQSLIGRLQTPYTAFSVPRAVPMFQSLIGRLQTVRRRMIEGVTGKFQSLIGRLQTIVTTSAPARSIEFQSLIGRLQTTGDFISAAGGT